MNKNRGIQDNIADSGDPNNYMIKVVNDNRTLATKFASTGGEGTIIVLTLESDRVKKF